MKSEEEIRKYLEFIRLSGLGESENGLFVAALLEWVLS